MNRGLRFLSLVFCFLVLFAHVSVAAEHGERPEKTGILLVAFGSSMPEAQVSFEKIDQSTKAVFPGVEIRWAYTSHIIRNILNKQGKDLKSPTEALAEMTDEGFTKVAVQSLHTIPGEEYSALKETAERFRGMPGGIEQIEIGSPLLYTSEDVQAVVDVMLENVITNRNRKEAVVLMGHGTHHPADVYYAALQQTFDLKTKGVFIGTVEGALTIEDVQGQLKEQGYSQVRLMPFMSVAGDHARNDMSGDEPDSWASILKAGGVKVTSVLKGTAEYDAITALWIAHLKDAFQALK